MSSEWRPAVLRELVSIKHGFAFKGEHFVDERTPLQLTTPGNFATNGGFQLGKGKYYAGPILNDYVLSTGDLIVTMTDLSKAADTLGYSAVIPETPGTIWLHNQRVGLVRPRDGTQVCMTYVHYLMRSPTYRHLVVSTATGSTVRHTSPDRILAYEFSIPPLAEQKQIGQLLSSLDDRITLLRETNVTLEAIAQALFKSWFVDFDPVRAKAEGLEPQAMDAATAALFPESFDESELGLVPKGWRVTACKNIMDVRDGTHESPKPSTSGYPLITSRHITSGEIITDDAYLIASEDYLSISKRSKVDSLDVLITMIGTVGIPAIVLDEAPEYAIKNIGLFKTSASPLLSHYMYVLLCSAVMQQYLLARLAGTTQKYLSLKALREISVLVPSGSILEEFSRVVTPLFGKVHHQRSQIKSLTQLRDTLLPRLISGQLRLPDAEQAVEEALA